MALPRRPCIALLLLLGACDFPLSAERYDIAAARDPGASSEPLVQVFADDEVECAECLRQSCSAQLKACSDDQGCFEFARCLQAARNPGGEAVCGEALGTSWATRMVYGRLRACWSGCVSECDVGTDFSCAYGYAAPRPPRPTITISQTLRFADLVQPLRGASVRLCPQLTGCDVPLATAVTNEQGSYTAEIPILVEPIPLAGWAGFRLVEGPEILPLHLASNLPVWSDRHDETQVLHSSTSQVILDGLGLTDRSVVFAQVFDCRLGGAGGVVFEVPGSATARVRYIDPSSLSSDYLQATLATAEGAAIIYGLAARESHFIVARHAATQQRVASGAVYVSGEHLVFFNLHPDPVTE
jgi:hypothetical protein